MGSADGRVACSLILMIAVAACKEEPGDTGAGGSSSHQSSATTTGTTSATSTGTQAGPGAGGAGGDASSTSSGPPPSCDRPPAKGSCYAADLGFCSEAYTDAEAAQLEGDCPGSATYSTEGCPSDGLVGYCALTATQLDYYYALAGGPSAGTVKDSCEIRGGLWCQ
jgi:hypothetical protein